ncbi:MAG TPA: NAD(P)H-binding protein [Candidatus Eisenbacteria bacterium]|nr:NAD(P)H-binding protein [Candidatus Eisenbacteria bacterium]
MILVTGATGYVGGAALRRLLAMGQPVAALARDAGRAAAALPAGVPIRVADYDDPPSLRRGLEGVSRLLFVASDGDGRDVIRHHANVVTAAASSGIEHLVFTSIVDLDEASPFYFTPVYRDAESRLAEIGAKVTLLRCGLYSDFLLSHWVGPALKTGRIALPVGAARVASVSRLDVAEAAAVAVVSDEHRGKSYELTGPEAHSFEAIARLAGPPAGVSIRYEPCSPSDYLTRAWRSLSDPWPHAFSTLCASISQGRYEAVSPDLEGLLGRPAERLEDFFRRSIPAGG